MTVDFPDTLEEIDDQAFKGCHVLAAVDLSVLDDTLPPAGGPTPGENADEAAAAAAVATPADAANAPPFLNTDPPGPTNGRNATREALVIGVSAFENCLLLSAVKFPDPMDRSRGDSIGESAFADCPSLTDINAGALRQMHLPDEGRGVFPRADGKSLIKIIDNDRFWTTALALERVRPDVAWRDIHGVIDTHIDKFTRDDYWGPYPKTPRDPTRARFKDKFACHV